VKRWAVSPLEKNSPSVIMSKRKMKLEKKLTKLQGNSDNRRMKAWVILLIDWRHKHWVTWRWKRWNSEEVCG
jgi:hypothetical protein